MDEIKLKGETSITFKKRELYELSLVEYTTLKNMGFLWEFYPKASGNYEEDIKRHNTDEKDT